MRSKEQGSVIGFVLGGILLLALLVGGIVLYKNNISKLTGVTNDSNQVATNDTDKQDEQTAEQKAEEQNKAANSNTAAPATQSTPTQNATQVPHTSTAPTQALPQTGPASDAAMAALGMSLVIGATSAYYRSRAAL